MTINLQWALRKCANKLYTQDDYIKTYVNERLLIIFSLLLYNVRLGGVGWSAVGAGTWNEKMTQQLFLLEVYICIICVIYSGNNNSNVDIDNILKLILAAILGITYKYPSLLVRLLT